MRWTPSGMETEPVSDEQLVTDLLSGIAWIGRAVTRKVIELRDDERLSGLTSTVDVGKTFDVDYPSGLPPGMYTDVVVNAYVDGSIKGAHGIAWTLDLIRRSHGWELDRSVTLHATTSATTSSRGCPISRFGTRRNCWRRSPRSSTSGSLCQSRRSRTEASGVTPEHWRRGCLPTYGAARVLCRGDR
jgi:hypothetical protein